MGVIPEDFSGDVRTDIQMPAILPSLDAAPNNIRSSGVIHSGLRYESLPRFHDGNEPLLVDWRLIEVEMEAALPHNPNVARPGNFKSMEGRTRRENQT
jgi:hypothetical protein